MEYLIRKYEDSVVYEILANSQQPHGSTGVRARGKNGERDSEEDVPLTADLIEEGLQRQHMFPLSNKLGSSRPEWHIIKNYIKNYLNAISQQLITELVVKTDRISE